MDDVVAPMGVIIALVGIGAVLLYGWMRRDEFQTANEARQREEEPQPPLVGQPSLLRLYRAPKPDQALAMFRDDASLLARDGYYPTSQAWVPGQWSWQAFAVAIALFLILVGIFVFIYMLIVKPDGTLTVTYELRTAQPAAASSAQPPPPAPAPDATLAARLAQLDEAHRAGLISDQEYAAKRQEMLSGF